MSKRAEPNMIVLVGGKLHRVISIGEGRTVTFEPIETPPCEHCGNRFRSHLLDHSPLYADLVKPVETI